MYLLKYTGRKVKVIIIIIQFTKEIGKPLTENTAAN